MGTRRFAAVICTLVLALTACGDGTDGDGAAPDATDDGVAADDGQAVPHFDEPIDWDPHRDMSGPRGEEVTLAEDFEGLTESEKEEIRQGEYTAALLWAGEGAWYDFLTNGVEAGLEDLGIEIVTRTHAGFDPATQAENVENAMAQNPDIIFSLPVDPEAAEAAFRPAVEAGVTIVFVDNAAANYTPGEDYVAVASGDHFQQGRQAAEAMAEALGDEGEVGFIFHDADFFITNNRDNTFRAMMEQEYDDMTIVDARGFTSEPETGSATVAMLDAHPEIDGVYVAWDVAAEFVVEELRAAGRDDVWVVTHDLGTQLDILMARGEFVYAKSADSPYNEGIKLTELAGYGLLGKQAPSFLVAQPMLVTRDNLVEGYEHHTGSPPPEEVMDALREAGLAD